MKRLIRSSTVSLTCVILAASFVAAFNGAGAGKAKPALGAAAPGFSLSDQEGKTVSLADFSGKIVVLEWFNNECPYVQKHYTNGDMNKLASSYGDKEVVWLAVNSTKGKTNADNKQIAGEWSIKRPILNDADGKVGHLYGAASTPHMFIVNKDGTLAYRGAIDSIRSSDAGDVSKATNHVKVALDELLAGKPVSVSETKQYGCSVKYAN